MFRVRSVLPKNRNNLLNLKPTPPPPTHNITNTTNSINCCNRSLTVMTFGDGSQGALGLPPSLTGHAADAYEPTPVSGLPRDVSSVAAGHYHSLAVTSAGELWAWGRNAEAQLGRGVLAQRDTWVEPKRVEGLSQVKVVGAFASGVVSAAVGDDGSLWVWGKSKRGQLGLGVGISEALVPWRVEALAGEEIAKVSFGWGHALAMTKDRKLFRWGYSGDARLGKIGPLDSTPNVTQGDIQSAERLVLEGIEKEKDMPIIWDPCLVEELHGIQVLDISCGLDHSLVLSGDGTLLSSGSNVFGQLGRANLEMGFFPVDMSSKPFYIASGLGHSLALCYSVPSNAETDAKSLMSWGWNRSSQLGRPGPENKPLEVEELTGESPILVSGGRAHSIALTSNGEVWVWGSGKSGRLGLGSSMDEPEPIPLDNLEGHEVLQVVSGLDHNLLLVAQ